MKNTVIHLIVLLTLIASVSSSCRKEVRGGGDSIDISVTEITLNNNELALFLGDTATLIATILPENATNKAIVWASSNTFVATVMPNGLVTALSEGKTTIVVSTQDGSKSASCAVTVGILVTGVTLNKNELVLGVNETETLVATIELANATNKTVTWKSSNNNVATVDNNGKVTTLAAGETVITVETASGGFSDECKVIIAPYREPYLTFGASKTTVKNYETRKLIEENDDYLLYEGENKDVVEVYYLFDFNKLWGSCVWLKNTSGIGNRIFNFLSEKYEYLGKEEEFHRFISLDKKMYILFGFEDEWNEWVVLYADEDYFFKSSFRTKGLKKSQSR